MNPNDFISVGLQYGFIGIVAGFLIHNLVKTNNTLTNIITKVIENNTKAINEMKGIIQNCHNEKDIKK